MHSGTEVYIFIQKLQRPVSFIDVIGKEFIIAWYDDLVLGVLQDMHNGTKV